MIKVAAAQIKVTNNVQKNLQTIIETIKKASKRKASIICFPETSLIHSTNKKLISKIDVQNLLKKIKEACKENETHCIFTTYYPEKNKIFNRAFLIDDKGKSIFEYDKVNLWKSERRKGIQSGKTNHTIKTKLGTLAIITCFDIAYPEYVKKIAKKADVLFCPSYVTDYGRQLETYNQLPLARAFESSCYVVYVDAFAKDTVQYSCIVSPDGIMSQIENKEGIIYADLELQKIRKIKKFYSEL